MAQPVTGEVLTWDGSKGKYSPAAVANSGIWGIANSAGVYTFYATYVAARVSGVSGQCVELFADIIESGAAYILKDGLNIDLHGHTISFTNNSEDGFTDNSSSVNCIISGWGVISKTGTTNYGLSILNSSSRIGCYCEIFNADTSGLGVMCHGNIYGSYINCANSIRLIGSFAIADFLKIQNFGTGIAVNLTTGSTINNSIINSSASATAVNIVSGYVNNCTIAISSGNYGCLITAGEIKNSSILADNTALFMIGGLATNCVIESVGGYSVDNNLSITGIYNKCTLIANSSPCASFGSTYKNCTFINNWNNSGGHGLIADNDTRIDHCEFILSNSSAYAITYTVPLTPTIYLTFSTLKGSNNMVIAGITQGQINTPDQYGNLVLN